MATTSTPDAGELRLALEDILVGDNVRDIDAEHVDNLVQSIALRGLLVPLIVRPTGAGYELVAGYHRYHACRKLTLTDVPVVVRDRDGLECRQRGGECHAQAADAARGGQGRAGDARRGLHPRRHSAGARLESPARHGPREDPQAPRHRAAARRDRRDPRQCDRRAAGDRRRVTGDRRGARRVDRRRRRRRLAASQQRRLGDRPSPPPRRQGHIRHVPEHRAAPRSESAAPRQEDRRARRRGRETAQAGRAVRLRPANVSLRHRRHRSGPAAGVLIELDGSNPIITDLALYRELAKQAIARTVEQLRERAAAKASGTRAGASKRERTRREELDVEHRATLRELTRQAHGTNLDLGTQLLTELAAVAPDDIDVARFFPLGLLGPESGNYLGTGDHVARTIAANGLRLVLDEHRTTTTPTLKSGKSGKTKVAYGDVDGAAKWMWRFVDGAKTAGELYGRVLVVFAAQHYASQLVLANSQRRGSVLPRSHKDIARKAFERVTKRVLPASHVRLQRALAAEARDYGAKIGELEEVARRARTKDGTVGEDARVGDDDQ